LELIAVRTLIKIQKEATPTVILVNRSPALVPNALCPPMPPNAPAKPPPLPRCSMTRIITMTADAVSKNLTKNSIMSIPLIRCTLHAHCPSGPGLPK
jgi:hypothetical protein